MDKENLAVVRQNFANTAFNHKVHEVACDQKNKAANNLKIIDIFVISLVLSLLIIQTLVPSNLAFSIVGASLTGAEILFMIIKLNFHFDEDAVAHKNTALKYMALRDKYKCLIVDIIKQSIKPAEITHRRNQLLNDYQMISDLAPQTNEKNYKKALKCLKIKQDDKNIWSDSQIDSLLPKELHKK